MQVAYTPYPKFTSWIHLLNVCLQTENPLGGEAEFKERLTNHLVPCLSQFAVAAGNDAQWKPLNYQVLLKTRHKSAQVRFAALKVLEGIHARLGEDFMVLLPETIPFLAELMEGRSRTLQPP